MAPGPPREPAAGHTARVVLWDVGAEAAARPSADLLARGEVFAGRRVLALLGRGSTAQVYRVLRGTGTAGGPRALEALKVVEPHVALTERGRERFHRECDIAGELHHPGVVSVLGHGEQERAAGRSPAGAPLLWAAMELLDGGTAAVLRPRGRGAPDVPRVLDVLARAAAGLDAVHAVDVVHRDVKPTNVLLAHPPSPRAAVTDFGLARFLDDARPLARNGRVAGSLPYASPEVLQAQRLTPAADVYSLACTAVELLSGEPPFPLPTTFAIARAHVSADPPRLSRRRRWLPRAVDGVVARGMAKQPRDRPTTCAALVELLAAALEVALGPGVTGS